MPIQTLWNVWRWPFKRCRWTEFTVATHPSHSAAFCATATALLMWLELTRNTAVPSAAAPPAWPNEVDGNTPALAAKDAGFTWGDHCINHCTGNHCTSATQEQTQILPIHHLPLFIFLLPPAERLQVTHSQAKWGASGGGRRTDGRNQSRLLISTSEQHCEVAEFHLKRGLSQKKKRNRLQQNNNLLCTRGQWRRWWAKRFNG